MKSVHLCIPVLKRYDLLRQLLLSLKNSSVKPAKVYIIDNGRDHARLAFALASQDFRFETWTPNKPLGVAESWNYFIDNVAEERLISNDDIVFGPTSLEQLMNTPGELISVAGVNMCSCFLLRDSCVKKVGLFDETISPGYAYFEDCDYAERMAQKGFQQVAIDCGVTHVGSQTLAAASPVELSEHHRKFKIAQGNFMTKWGRLPAGVTFQV